MEEIKKELKKIDNIKSLNEHSEEIGNYANRNEVERMHEINNKLLSIAEKELNKGIVPSREVLDTITTALIITAALPWSKYSI